MKKIVIISSSPRKGGNSDLLCDRFAEGAKASGNEVEKIRIADLKIGFCHACYVCKKTGKCVQQDDARAVIDKMMGADAIVLATPVYFYTLSAQLKALFDRTVAVFPKLTGKKFYYIMTMADGDRRMFEGVFAAMRGFLDCYDGSTLEGAVCAPGVYEKGAVKDSPAWNEAYELGRQVK